MEIFTSQSARSYYCSPWSPHSRLIAFQLLPCSTIMSSLWDSLSWISCMLPGLSHCIPFHPSLSFSVRTYFGQIKSIVRLEKSYLVISVLPESSAYGPFIPLPCQVYLPTSSLVLPPLCRLQYSMFASHLSDAILERYCALNPTMEH